MPELTKEQQENVQKEGMQAIAALRESIEKKEVIDVEKQKKLDTAIVKFEDENLKLVKKLKEVEAKSLEMKELYATMENSLNGSHSNKSNYKNSNEYKAFDKAFRKGEDECSIEERKYLRTDNAIDGGFLVRSEFVAELIKDITEVSPIRSIARVRSTTSKNIEIPIRTNLVQADWEGENEESIESNSKYGLHKIPTSKLTVTVPVTREELQDAEFNIEAEIRMDVVERGAQKEGEAFVNGDATKKPQGFLVAPDVPEFNSGIANAINMDTILEITGELKTGYNPMYGANRRTTAKIRTLKDGVGQYLWQAGNIAASLPNTIAGFPYIEIPDMPDIAPNEFPIIFGDFLRGYLIGDRMAMEVIRDPFTRKTFGIVEFTFIRRVAGQVVQPEAFVKYKIAV